MTEEKPSYYAVIPANVRYDKDLKPNAKLLYGEITCLSQKEGYCFATNSYFAELYDVDNSTVSKWVNQLAEKGYILVDYIYEGKECKQRRIAINQYLLKKNQGGIEKMPIGYCKNAKDNNTSNNNINNNIYGENQKTDNSRFKKPTVEEIKAYCEERQNGINAEHFYDFYESKNWFVGKNKMKDWKACVRTWEKNNYKRTTQKRSSYDVACNHIDSNHDYSQDAGEILPNGEIGF